MKITDRAGGKWVVARQLGAWRRKSRVLWAFELMPSGLGDDPISLIIAIPFLVLALIVVVFALVELLLLLVAWPVVLLLRLVGLTGWRVVVLNTAKPYGATKSGKPDMKHGRFSTTVLETRTLAGSTRLRDVIAKHLSDGGDVTDRVVGQWLSAENARLVRQETKSVPA